MEDRRKTPALGLSNTLQMLTQSIAAGATQAQNQLQQHVGGMVDNWRFNLHKRQLRLQYGGTGNHVRTVRNGAFAAVIPGDSAVEAVLTLGINNFLSLYNVALIARLILTWFPQPPEAIVGPLSSITDPYLNLFRGIIPPLGGTIDLSPILAFITLDLFSNAFAALPAELGPDGQSRAQHTRKFAAFGVSQNRAALLRHKQATAQRRDQQDA